MPQARVRLTPTNNYLRSKPKEAAKDKPLFTQRLPASGPVHGLGNAPGENNCFLNVVLQALTHAPEFRKLLKQKHGSHRCAGSYCPTCRLSEVMEQTQEERAARLRQVLARGGTVFEIGKASDAVELYAHVVERLHDQAPGDTDESWVRELLAVRTVTRWACRACGQGTPQRTMDVWDTLLYAHAAQLGKADFAQCDNTRINVLKLVAADPGPVPCESCAAELKRSEKVMNLPTVLAFGVVWRASPTAEETACVSNVLFDVVDLKQHPQLASVPDAERFARLIGVVGYYGSHYVGYFLNEELGEWLQTDDTQVRRIGTNVDEMTHHMKNGRYRQTMLLYKTRQEAPTPEEHERARIDSSVVRRREERELEVMRQPSPRAGGVSTAAASPAGTDARAAEPRAAAAAANVMTPLAEARDADLVDADEQMTDRAVRASLERGEPPVAEAKRPGVPNLVFGRSSQKQAASAPPVRGERLFKTGITGPRPSPRKSAPSPRDLPPSYPHGDFSGTGTYTSTSRARPAGNSLFRYS